MITESLQSFYKAVVSGKRLLAIDHGSKKIGFALSDHHLRLAMPLKLIHESVVSKQIEYIVNMIAEYDIGGLVLGLPVNMDGSTGEQAQKVRILAEKITQRINLPIFLQDERLTSKTADSLLKSVGYKRKQRNKVDDLAAASLILETVLDSRDRL